MPIPLPSNAKKVFSSELLHIYEWPQIQFDGSIKTFESCVRPDSVGIIAFIDEQTILLGTQSQPGRGAYVDLPGGRVDENETPEQAAHRELLEETGYTADTWSFWVSRKYNGITQFETFFFLAKNLHKKEEPQKDPGEKATFIPTTLGDAVRQYLHIGRRADAEAVLLAMHYDPDTQIRLKHFLKN